MGCRLFAAGNRGQCPEPEHRHQRLSCTRGGVFESSGWHELPITGGCCPRECRAPCIFCCHPAVAAVHTVIPFLPHPAPLLGRVCVPSVCTCADNPIRFSKVYPLRHFKPSSSLTPVCFPFALSATHDDLSMLACSGVGAHTTTRPVCPHVGVRAVSLELLHIVPCSLRTVRRSVLLYAHRAQGPERVAL